MLVLHIDTKEDMSEFCLTFEPSQFPNSAAMKMIDSDKVLYFTEVMCLLFQLDVSLEVLCREWSSSACLVRGVSRVFAAATLLFLLSDSLKT